MKMKIREIDYQIVLMKRFLSDLEYVKGEI